MFKFFLPLLFWGCAETPYYLDTQRLAATQDSVIANWLPSAAVAPFRPLVEAQRLFTTSNLTIRMDGIEGRWRAAESTYFAFITPSGWWPEGLSYAMYTDAVFSWGGFKPFPWPRRYGILAGPDGAVALPEVSDIRVVPDTAALYADSDYVVFREKADSSFVLIGISTDLSYYKNLHFHPTGFAVYRRGRWLSRPVPYTGFSLSRAFADEFTWNTVPPRVFGPTWRSKRPRIRIIELTSKKISILYIIDNGDTVLREYFISPGVLEVRDNGNLVFRG